MDELELREQHRRDATGAMSALLEPLDWPPEKLVTERRARLRTLLSLAQRASPWIAERTRHLDLQHLTEADLATVPPMTKADLLDNWDSIVTDPRLTRARAENHVNQGGYVDGQYTVVVSGGSSGVRAIVAKGWGEFAEESVVHRRCYLRWSIRTGSPLGGNAISVAAPPGPHFSSRISQLHGSPAVPVTTPASELVTELNRMQPTTVGVYPSFIPVLAALAEEGRLRIAPVAFLTAGEPLLEEHRLIARDVWSAEVFDLYGSSETGWLASSSGFDEGLLLFDDRAVIEAVDESGEPVAPGEEAAKLYVTPLCATAMPLVRYTVEDRLTILAEPPSCGSAFRLASHVVGRADDVFVYPTGIRVHPVTFRAPLGRDRAITEYQVRQTANGAEVRVVASGPIDCERIEAMLGRALSAVGLRKPIVNVRRVFQLERTNTVGKLRRFISLT